MQSLRLLSDDITTAIIDDITFSDVNLKDGVRNFHYNKCLSRTWEFSIFILPGYDKNFYPRVSLSGVQKDSFCDFLFPFLQTKSLMKRDIL